MTAVGEERQALHAHAKPSQPRAFLHVVRRCLRDQRRSPLTWGVPLGLMSALELAIYPSVHESLSKALNSYPQALKDAFRMQTIDSPAKFVNGEMFTLIIPLAVGFFVIRAASRAVAGHEERHWLDTVLTTPVRRRTLLAGAFSASAISSLAILAVTGLLVFASGHIFGAVVPLGDVAAGVFGTWPFAIFFAGLGALVAGRIGNWGAVTGIAGGMLVAMYVVDIAARISSALEPVGYATAFHWYGSPLIDGLDGGHALLAGLAVALAFAGAALFERRDVSG